MANRCLLEDLRRPLRLAVGGALVYVVALFCCVRIRGNNLLWFCF